MRLSPWRLGPRWLLAGLWPLQAQAGAFNEPAGHGQVIITQERSSASQYWQANGTTRLPVDYRLRDRNILLQYGVTDRLMLILKTTRFAASGTGSATYAAAGPTTLGVQIKLPTLAGLTLAAQMLEHLPSAPMRQGTWLFGQTRIETELRLLAGKSMRLLGRRVFFDLQSGYRLRNDGLGREWHMDVTQGFDIAPATTLLLQSFTTKASARPDVPYALFEQHKRQMSLVRAFGPWSLQLGLFRTTSGRRAYAERGSIVAVWIKF